MVSYVVNLKCINTIQFLIKYALAINDIKAVIDNKIPSHSYPFVPNPAKANGIQAKPTTNKNNPNNLFLIKLPRPIFTPPLFICLRL